MLLNRFNFYKFTRNDFFKTKETYMFSLRSWGDRDYWYFEFELGTAFTKYDVISTIPHEVLSKIKTDKNTFLVASNAYESFHDIVEPLYDFLIANNIPLSKTILISESATIDKEVIDVSERLGLEKISTWWSLGFERMVKKYKREQPIKHLPTLQNTYYEKKFINFNRRWRLHRPVLVLLLKMYNLLDHGYISLGRGDDNKDWTESLIGIIHKHRGTCIFELVEKFKKEIKELPDMYLDTTDLITNQAHITSDTDQMYINTYFSVISETYFYSTDNSGIFFSEKIFKPIASLHPFILVGQANSLEKLKLLGYKTFDPVIDETYDQELDDSKRMLMIVKEIDRLCNLTESELNNFINFAIPIVQHNYNILMTKSDRIIELI